MYRASSSNKHNVRVLIPQTARFGVLSWKKGTRRAGWVARGFELGARGAGWVALRMGGNADGLGLRVPPIRPSSDPRASVDEGKKMTLHLCSLTVKLLCIYTYVQVGKLSVNFVV